MLKKGIVVAAVLALGLAGVATAEYREEPVANGGGIAGRVRVTGDVPKLPPQPVFKHQEECGTSIPDERVVVDGAGGLSNAVVSLANVSAGKPIPRDRAVLLDNRKCAFVPHVLSATAGQTLEIKNSDPFLHDAHASLGPRTLFNVALPKGRTVHEPIAFPGLVDINCNVRHTWMHAYLYVADHPYHTVTGGGGSFRIDQIPPGRYTVTVWHELLGSAEKQIVVEPGKTTSVDFELQSTAAAP